MRFIKYFLSLVFLILFQFCASAQNSEAIASYSIALDEILIDDQRYRKSDEKNKQVELDQQNRERLDELYTQYGFPTIAKVGRERLLTSILVLHHSEDCNWNKKWVKIFLDNYEESKEFSTLMAYMFERTYGSELGICKDQEWIDQIKKNYSSEVIRAFKIDAL